MLMSPPEPPGSIRRKNAFQAFSSLWLVPAPLRSRMYRNNADRAQRVPTDSGGASEATRMSLPGTRVSSSLPHPSNLPNLRTITRPVLPQP
jgi:hypothetical protein